MSIEEVTDWVNRVGQIEDPHHCARERQPGNHAQVYAPEKYPAIKGFAWLFINNIISRGDILVHVVDWFPYDDSEKFLFERIWNDNGKARNLEETPGCLLSWDERESAIALFSIMSCFRWQCYLYGSHDQLILYNWEGEIWDMWSSSLGKMNEIGMIIGRLGFSKVPDGHEEDKD